jgi:hypothetical protein
MTRPRYGEYDVEEERRFVIGVLICGYNAVKTAIVPLPASA